MYGDGTSLVGRVGAPECNLPVVALIEPEGGIVEFDDDAMLEMEMRLVEEEEERERRPPWYQTPEE
eukprot:9106554-Heterocapsa_arctica.AAC.1